MEVIVTTPEEIRAIVNECLAGKIPVTNPQTINTEIEKPLTQPEAVEFLGKSRQTLTSWRKKGIIKAHVLGGRIYFLKSELLAAMK